MAVPSPFTSIPSLQAYQPNLPVIGLTTRWSTKRCLSIHAAVVVLGIVFYQLAPPGLALIFTGLIVSGFFFSMVLIEAKQTSMKVTPISVYFLWQGFALGVAAVYIGFKISDGSSLLMGVHHLPPEYVALGYMIGLAGTLPFHAGLQIFRAPAIAQFSKQITQDAVTRMLPKLVIFFTIGFVALRLGKQLNFLGILSASFEYAGHAALISFALIPSEKLRTTESMRLLLLLVGTALLFFAATTSGSKQYLMTSLIGVFIYATQRKSFRVHLPAVSLLLIFIYLSVIAPTVSNARRIRGSYNLSLAEAQWEAFKQFSPLSTGKFDIEFYREQAETLLSRQFESSSIAFIAQNVDVRGYLNGETYYEMRYAFIPRILWPEKPLVVRGGWFSSYTGASARASDATFAIGMEAAGELYWNFGYLGVVGGMFCLGALIGKLWALAGADPRFELVALCLYAQTTLSMMNLPEAGSRVVSCIGQLVIFGLLIYFARPRNESRTVFFRRHRMA